MFKIITVIGANGTMGANASAIFASFGNAKVYMISRDIQKSRIAINKAIQSVRAEAIRSNLIACDYSRLKECVEESDLVFESVAEDLEIKKEITSKIGNYVKKNTIIATGTSGLSINEIANVLPYELRKRYFGMHFFNPPYSLSLLELIPSSYALIEDVNNLRNYLESVLLRDVIICKDSPAFLANRIGFYFLNLCLQYAETYKNEGGIDYIDAIIGPFTGRSMMPCTTVDFVGLDVHKAIVDNVRIKTNDYNNDAFLLPSYVQDLIDQGKLGRKTNSGLFKIDVDGDGKRIKWVYDILTCQNRHPKKYDFHFSKEMNAYLRNGDYELAFQILIEDSSEEAMICKKILKEYVDYSLYVANEVCDDISYVDDAMANGFNWCPPLLLSNLLFGTNYRTRYDYRSFFRAVM